MHLDRVSGQPKTHWRGLLEGRPCWRALWRALLDCGPTGGARRRESAALSHIILVQQDCSSSWQLLIGPFKKTAIGPFDRAPPTGPFGKMEGPFGTKGDPLGPSGIHPGFSMDPSRAQNGPSLGPGWIQPGPKLDPPSPPLAPSPNELSNPNRRPLPTRDGGALQPED